MYTKSDIYAYTHIGMVMCIYTYWLVDSLHHKFLWLSLKLAIDYSNRQTAGQTSLVMDKQVMYMIARFVVLQHTTRYGRYISVQEGVDMGGTYQSVGTPHHIVCQYIGTYLTDDRSIHWYRSVRRTMHDTASCCILFVDDIVLVDEILII